MNSVMPIFAIVILSGNDYSTVNTATQLQIVMMLLYVLAIDFRRHNHVDVCLTAVRSKIDVMSRLLFFARPYRRLAIMSERQRKQEMANVTILEIGALIDDGMMAGNGHTPVNFIPNSDPLLLFVPVYSLASFIRFITPFFFGFSHPCFVHLL